MNRRSTVFAMVYLALLPFAATARSLPPQPSPADLYQELFVAVQSTRLFPPDSNKTFVDAIPKSPPPEILRAYRADKPKGDAALERFVRAHFIVPEPVVVPLAPPNPRPLKEHIAALWPHLIRPPDTPPAHSSQLAFAYSHVVPGGRFREIYYWDSYFTLIGLTLDGRSDITQNMVDGFADLIHRYGHIPNGTRTYYLSRSQPPFFFRMVALLAPQDPAAAYAKYLPALREEHEFWMKGARRVQLPDGSVLNRYWDARTTPREEGFLEDTALAKRTSRSPADLYRNVRAAAESGWDFSSRWFAEPGKLESIETTSLLPVDLNSLLFGLEQAIAQGCARKQDRACTQDFTRRATLRREAMNQYLWHAAEGRYLDYHWRRGEPSPRLSAATLYPLFTGAAGFAQANAVARTVREQLLAKGGLETTTERTGEQWDRPNGWAPLQWIAVSGLRDYGQNALARDIATRWLSTVEISYRAQGKLVEKYDVDSQSPGGGGLYPLQDGFGWTNGVTRALLELYPLQTQHSAPVQRDRPLMNVSTRGQILSGNAQ